MEAAVVTAAVVVMAVVAAEAAIVTAIVAPAAMTANQGGNIQGKRKKQKGKSQTALRRPF
jgi:hypothetical protein